MSALITVSLGILFLAAALTITSPLIDKVLTTDTIQVMENAITNIEFFIGSENTNTFIILLLVIIIFIIFRFAYSFFGGQQNN